MTDQDYIKAAGELADGWTLSKDDHLEVRRKSMGIMFDAYGYDFDSLGDFELDALAAQLVSQVDKSGRGRFYSVPGAAELQWEHSTPVQLIHSYVKGDDRAMNSIKVIVDSKVLKNG